VPVGRPGSAFAAAFRLPVPLGVAGFALVVPVATWSYSIVYGRFGTAHQPSCWATARDARAARTPSMRVSRSGSTGT
jgi:hypothetical protein